MRSLSDYSPETVYKWWQATNAMYGLPPETFEYFQQIGLYEKQIARESEWNFQGLYGKDGWINFLIRTSQLAGRERTSQLPIQLQIEKLTRGFNPLFIGIAGAVIYFSWKPIKKLLKIR